jgi:hypothetical protein
MPAALVASAVIGVLCSTFVWVTMGGLPDMAAFTASCLIPGAVSGTVAGLLTIWSRKRRGGKERLLDAVATYYLGLIIYWASFVVTESILRTGGYDLHELFPMLAAILFYGTLPLGAILVPFSLLSRYVIWMLYTRSSV